MDSHCHDADWTRALLRLVIAQGAIAPRLALLRHPDGLIAALAAGDTCWRRAGCTPAQRASLAQDDPPGLAAALRWLDAPGHQLLAIDDPAFPPQLGQAPDPPLALFVKGALERLWHPAVAIVGSRSPTPTGRAIAAEFAQAFAEAGLAVASGLAAGIDAIAHRATLAAQGLTVAVIGTGPDLAYPDHHCALQAQIADAGVLVSEYPPGTPARPAHFPARNRLVAGLAQATVVVEAAQRSGALITARLAAEAGREVCAVPGSVRNPRARGCHRLIRDGAALVESADEVLALLAPGLVRSLPGLQFPRATPIHRAQTVQLSAPFADDADYQCLWQALDHDPIPMDSLITRCGLTAARLSSMLLAMELAGIVVCEHGRYCRSP